MQTNPIGKFFVIDGTDGSGKSTQFKLLAERFQQEGFDVVTIKFPQYGKKSAGAIEEYLNSKYGQMNPYACSILYAVDRFDASFQIQEWLKEGKIVLADRYVLANAGHQGGKISDPGERKSYFDWLNHLEHTIFNIPKPDLNIILHIPSEIAQSLMDNRDTSSRTYIGGKKHDIHEADLNHLKNAERVYLELADLFPNTELVECMENKKLLSIEEIHEQVWDIIKNMLAVSVVTESVILDTSKEAA